MNGETSMKHTTTMGISCIASRWSLGQWTNLCLVIILFWKAQVNTMDQLSERAYLINNLCIPFHFTIPHLFNSNIWLLVDIPSLHLCRRRWDTRASGYLLMTFTSFVIFIIVELNAGFGVNPVLFFAILPWEWFSPPANFRQMVEWNGRKLTFYNLIYSPCPKRCCTNNDTSGISVVIHRGSWSKGSPVNSSGIMAATEGSRQAVVCI